MLIHHVKLAPVFPEDVENYALHLQIGDFFYLMYFFFLNGAFFKGIVVNEK